MIKSEYFSCEEEVDAAWEQILFWQTHLDIFIRDVLKVKLKDTQMVIARACGNGSNIKIVKSRGYGKSWLIAWVLIALAMLNPDTPVIVVSATMKQSTIILKKIQSFTSTYPELLQYIKMVGREPVIISNDSARVYFKNGSRIESRSLSAVVGERAKILVIDEAPRASENDIKKSAIPVSNYTRDICVQNGFDDFKSKVISITSACLKSNYFYSDFVHTLEQMRKGDKECFACALDYNSAIRVGITKPDFFDEQRKTLPESVFLSEYGSIFLGEEANSIFPYELTSMVRKLKRVEYAMPKGSQAWYTISVDIATSSAKTSDNAVITVLKNTDRDDGSILKQLVYIRSYNGKRLDELADEVRKTYVRFPNTEKIIFDHRGLGDSFPLFFNEPWIDPDTDREYPAWCLDDEPSRVAVPMLRGFKANVVLNQELVTSVRVSLEQKTLTLPVNSREFDFEEVYRNNQLRKEELAIYIEADALQVEMGNIVMKPSTSGKNALYDTAKHTQHKDRYSSLAMNVWYVHKIEQENKRIIAERGHGAPCIGIVSRVR